MKQTIFVDRVGAARFANLEVSIMTTDKVEEESSLHSIRILLIEDNPMDIFLLQQALDASGLETQLTVFSDGEEAIQSIAHWNGTYLPDLIVLDLNLPRRSGLEILRAIRESARLSKAAVVVLSSSESLQERQAMGALGVRRFFVKPFRFSGYLELGRNLSALVAE